MANNLYMLKKNRSYKLFVLKGVKFFKIFGTTTGVNKSMREVNYCQGSGCKQRIEANVMKLTTV